MNSFPHFCTMYRPDYSCSECFVITFKLISKGVLMKNSLLLISSFFRAVIIFKSLTSVLSFVTVIYIV